MRTNNDMQGDSRKKERRSKRDTERRRVIEKKRKKLTENTCRQKDERTPFKMRTHNALKVNFRD